MLAQCWMREEEVAVTVAGCLVSRIAGRRAVATCRPFLREMGRRCFKAGYYNEIGVCEEMTRGIPR